MWLPLQLMRNSALKPTLPCPCRHPSMQLVEARCLGRSGAPAAALSAGATGGRFAVNAAVVREYLTALVVTGRLSQFGDDPSAAPDQGQSHRSLRQLLAELQALSAGKQVPGAPGATVAHPLHVIVQSQVRWGAVGRWHGPAALVPAATVHMCRFVAGDALIAAAPLPSACSRQLGLLLLAPAALQ